MAGRKAEQATLGWQGGGEAGSRLQEHNLNLLSAYHSHTDPARPTLRVRPQGQLLFLRI